MSNNTLQERLVQLTAARAANMIDQATYDAAVAALSGGDAMVVGTQGVGVGGHNYGTINTGVWLNVQGDEVQRLVELARVTSAAALLAPPINAARKQEVEQYFNAIAETLDACAVVLKQRQIPHGKCGELEGYAYTLPEAVSDLIGTQQASIFKEKLIQNHEIESYGTRYFSLPQLEMEAVFGQLEEAAGYFRAAAKSIRVKP